MFAICYVMSVGRRVRSHEVIVEISSDGRLPDYIMVQGEVIDSSKFDPRANWDGWVSGIENANVTNTRCDRFAGVTYIDAKVLNKFMAVTLVAGICEVVNCDKVKVPPPGSKTASSSINVLSSLASVRSLIATKQWMECTSDKD